MAGSLRVCKQRGGGDEVAGPLRGDAAAERMGLIAMKASGRAGRAGGVAYLRATRAWPPVRCMGCAAVIRRQGS